MDPLSCQDDDSLDFLQCARSFPLSRQDAEGNVYAFREMSDRTELWRTRPDGEPELVAQITGEMQIQLLIRFPRKFYCGVHRNQNQDNSEA